MELCCCDGCQFVCNYQRVFLIESRIRVQKLIDIVIEVFIWSLGIYIVLTLTGFVPFSLVGLVKSAFPILTKQYWFVSVYVGMYLLSPFVAKGLKSLRQKQHLALMCILICMTTLYLPSKAIGENGYSIVWMLTLYVIAAYLRLYYKPNGKSVSARLRLVLFRFCCCFSQKW